MRTLFRRLCASLTTLVQFNAPRKSRSRQVAQRRRMPLSFDPLEERTMLAVDVNLLRDINAGAPASQPFGFTNVNDTVFFSAGTAAQGPELWKTDGTSLGTVLVKEIQSGTFGSFPRSLTNVNGTLLFVATSSFQDYELWKSDGTSSGTVLVKDIKPGLFESDIRYMINVNGTVYFHAEDGVNGFELWKSDGTSSGTVMVKNINPGAGNALPQYLINVNGTLYFQADDGVNGSELWKSDGTSSGTVLVKDINPGGYPSVAQKFTNVNGTLFFTAGRISDGFELWKTDGTSTGTVLVKDIRPGLNSSYILEMSNVNGTLFLVADNGTSGFELWKSNGTSSGTVLVRDINVGGNSSFASNPLIVNIGGLALFSANDGVNGYELWKSDGTSSGTLMIRNIHTTSSSTPGNITNFQGRAYFSATDGVFGREVWSTDGTSSGTTRVTDLNPGVADSDPIRFRNFNDILYFSADNGTQGREPHRLTQTNEIVSGVNSAAVVGGPTNDTILLNFTNTTSFGLQLNGGTTVPFDTFGQRNISLEGNGGNDQVLIYLSSLSDTVTFNQNNATVTSSGYTVNISNVGTKYIFGGTADQATFSELANVTQLTYFLATHAIDYLPVFGVFNEAIGFGSYIGAATGEDDYLFMYSSSGANNFVSNPDQSTVTDNGTVLTGLGYRNVLLQSLDQNDSVQFTGTTSNEIFTSVSSVYTVVFAPEFVQYFVGFPSVEATGGGGFDQAVMYDSGGADTFVGNTLGGAFEATHSGASTFSNRVLDYDSVYVWQYFGGADTANITIGASGVTGASNAVVSSVGEGTQNVAVGFGGSNSVIQALNFRNVNVTSRMSFTAALVEDFALGGTDVLTLAGSNAGLVNTDGRSVNITGITQGIAATSKNGGTNRLVRNNPGYLVTQVGNWTA